MTLKRSLCSLFWLLLFAAASSAMQANAQAKSFEVVSIRQNISRTRPGTQALTPSPDGFRISSAPLQMLIMTAYRRSDGTLFVNSIEKLPDWSNDRYDIDARVADEDRAAWQDPKNQPAMLESMLQTMLADRFKLAAHRANKTVPVYNLAVTKDGPKLAETKADERIPSGLTLPGGGVIVQGDSPSGQSAHLYNFTMGLLASLLTTQSDRPIKDKTGLTGRYDMFIRKPARMAAPSADLNGTHDENADASMSEVLKGLGLKLEPAKEEVETLVIDQMERPTEN
ncbi:MAG TPA: TIGR03435 family protein [Acidobacteriaceae bacterium]